METIYLIMPGKISDGFAEIVKIATENCQLTAENIKREIKK